VQKQDRAKAVVAPERASLETERVARRRPAKENA
jgi:hypothetical protein